MTYALHLADEAWAAINRLPVLVQEEVFDLLERLTGEGAALPDIGAQQIVYQDEASKFYVYVIIASSAESQTLNVDHVHWVVEP